MGGTGLLMKTSPRLATRVCKEQEPPHAFRRGRRARIPAAEFMRIGLYFEEIEEHVAIRCLCSNTIDVNT